MLIATAAYSYLFYYQSPGINFLLFAVLIIVLFFLKDRSLIYRPAWIAVAAGTILSAFFVFWWGTALPVLANACSLLALAGFSFDAESSFLFAVGNTIAAILIAIPRLFHSTVEEQQPEDKTPRILKKLLLLIAPVLVTLLFVAIYCNANPIFAKFVDQINLDFINFNWAIFTLSGFFIMFGLFNIYRFKVNESDKNASDTLRLITAEEHVQSGSGSWLSAPNELLMGMVMFALLNLVLFTVNGLNVFYMWVNNRLPEGVSVAEFLHDGADTLILSIILAIAVLLFVFRGYLNFAENNRWLKMLAYTWIAQNALLVITTANTNWWIIQSSGLTRRRIGVYVYLALCIIGLTTTFIKVAKRKTNWFLFRKNAWAFYAVFIAGCFFNWDEIIVNYNCKNYKSLELAYIDRGYQTELSYTCLATLYKYYVAEKKEPAISKKIFTGPVINAMHSNYYYLQKEVAEHGWQSFCYGKYKNLHQIENMVKSGEVVN